MSTTPVAGAKPGVLRLAAHVRDVEADEGRYGPRFTWWFEADGDRGPRTIRTWTSRHLHPLSRASAYLKAIVGRRPDSGEDIDLEALRGSACTLEVAPNKDGYLVVKAVLPADRDMPL